MKQPQQITVSTAVINDHQKRIYEEVERETAERWIRIYSGVLESVRARGKIKILDIGGASGYFSLALSQYFSGVDCEIFVIDNTRYDTWDELGGRITFIEESAQNIGKVFPENTFDLVFANRVFHHIVQKTWSGTVAGITDIMRQISETMKDDGYFCLTEHLYNGAIFDTSASRIIYTLTSCKIPLLAKIFRRIEAKSAGVGTCFLSRKKWMSIFGESGFVADMAHEGNKMRWTILKVLVYRALLLIKNHDLNAAFVLRK